MREAELWERLRRHLGDGYASVWADTQVLVGLQGRTVAEAIGQGVPSKTIWRAAWSALELPLRER